MKKISKKSILSGLALLGVTLIIGFVNALLIDIDNSVDLPNVRFHSLFLGSSSSSEGANVYMSDESNVNVLMIGSGLMFGGLDVGIGGGSGNKIMNGVNPTKVIGGGEDNHSISEGGVIVGGFGNNANNGVVVGGFGNEATESTILGGLNNRTLSSNSLAFGSGASAYEYGFSWNSNISDSSNMARIDAVSGVLIGTYNPVTGVNLVVNGAVKIGGEEIGDDGSIAGEIRAVSGCYYAFDGSNWHVINDGDVTDCGEFELDGVCKFGNVMMFSGQVLTGYTQMFSSSCTEVEVKCSGGNLNPSNVYSFCYKYTY